MNNNTSDQLFLDAGEEIDSPRILEMGVKRSNPDISTMVGRSWFPRAKEIIGTDFDDGIDVDMLADAHSLYAVARQYGFLKDGFDIIISRSVFEHLEKPWIVAKEIHRCLKPGGLVYVQTHQTFPIHGYPRDYWRFTTEALESIFSDFEIIKSDYKFPCEIHSAEVPATRYCKAYLNVNLFARKGK